MNLILQKEPNLQEYIFNFDDLKNELSLNLEKYKNLVVSEDAIKEAKGTRADLNKLKKEITDKVREIKNIHLKPFDEFKSKTDQLVRLIDEPVYAIDSQIKSYEQKVKDEKLAEIMQLWESEKPSCVDIPFTDIFREQWLNATVSIKKVRQDMIDLAIKVTQDLQVIESFNSEFEVPLKEVYLKNFDMSAAMKEKSRFEQRKLEEAERQEKLRQELERKEALRKAEEERRQAEQMAKVDITAPPIEENKIDITKPEDEPDLLSFTYEIIGTLSDKNNIEDYFYEAGYNFNCINIEAYKPYECNEKELIGDEEIPF